LFPSYQELLEGKNTFDEDDSGDSLDCGFALDAGTSLDAGTVLDVGAEPSFADDVVSVGVISEFSRESEGALDLSSPQAEKSIARLNKIPIADKIFFFMFPFLLNGNAPNIHYLSS
jgi:hypothetical protein